MHARERYISAPGKSILHGEHAVVHGKVALAVSLNLRTYLRLQATSAGKVCVNLPNIDTFLSWDITALKSLLSGWKADCSSSELDSNLVKRLREFMAITDGSTDTRSMAVLAFLYIYLSVFADAEVLPSLSVCVWSELPTGAGLGSSAAFSVCLSAALLSARGTISTPLIQQQNTARWSDAELELINKWAFQGEKIIHGNPSGVDNAVSTWGGVLRYHAGMITPLSRVPTLRILLTNTKVPRSTKVLVSGVKDKINKYPSVMTPVLDSVDAVSQACEQTLADMATEGASTKHYNILEDLIDINQHHLNVMGVGHSSLDTLCRVTLAHGLHSKLTGAGGGGCGITLLRPETEPSVVQAAVQELKEAGFECWETSLGGPGVLLHSSNSITQDTLSILTSY
ncbi:mevalonate kinase [Pygocentrus nattereri]|uniref:Mevalonate kinase n=1 Tax=Pygocentrus nattereri TaxID=42514 RepID=A0A3B4BUV8_PYGNA|nr:mevalonate kinase [Pygocentrus nattereri]XP_017564803.1 mevalonate kinase [Pygocentrus nattereri]XP_017564804.1 mevalonate kinase [Pygocentrus nattereri]XP_017564805.1 mevalonate kinase [Pygocentrus nattereri]